MRRRGFCRSFYRITIRLVGLLFSWDQHCLPSLRIDDHGEVVSWAGNYCTRERKTPIILIGIEFALGYRVFREVEAAGLRKLLGN